MGGMEGQAHEAELDLDHGMAVDLGCRAVVDLDHGAVEDLENEVEPAEQGAKAKPAELKISWAEQRHGQTTLTVTEQPKSL